MMTAIEEGKNFLLSSGLEVREIKDDVFQIFLLRTLNTLEPSKCTFDGLKEELSAKYEFSVLHIFLKTIMDDLKEKNYINWEFGEEGKLFYNVSEKGNEWLKDNAKYKDQLIIEYFKRILNEVPDHLREEAYKFKEDIVTDFILAYSMELDKFYFDMVLKKTHPPKKINAKLSCRVKEISPELRKTLTGIYTAFYDPDKHPEVFNKLFDISFLWNSIRRLYSLRAEDRKLFLDGIKETQIFADTNTIIAYMCHEHPYHDKTLMSYDSIRNRLGIEIFYSVETRKELKKIMDINRKVVKCLQYYPEKACRIAEEVDHPVLQGFFYENYIDWVTYEKNFWNEMNKTFKPFEEKKKIAEIAKDESMKILPKVEKIMNKKGEVAKHDAYLIALVRVLREVRSEELHVDWFKYFKYIDWISTHDYMFRKYDRKEGTDPVSFLVKFLPVYFHPYYIAKAIEEIGLKGSYDLLYDASFLLSAENRAEYRHKALNETINEIAKISDEDQLKESLVMFTKESLDEMDLDGENENT